MTNSKTIVKIKIRTRVNITEVQPKWKWGMGTKVNCEVQDMAWSIN